MLMSCSDSFLDPARAKEVQMQAALRAWSRKSGLAGSGRKSAGCQQVPTSFRMGTTVDSM